MRSKQANPAKSGDLPQPGEEAGAHNLRIVEQIKQQIKSAGGQISFEAYMQSALYLPELGYYRCGTEKFGALGDFITAPEISPLFAQSLAHFIQSTSVGASVLEVGAGNGLMAKGILQALKAHSALPDTYYILELSAELRERQRQAIAQVPGLIDRVSWLDCLPEDFSGVVVANELLDAMPVTRFRLDHEKIYEQQVACRDNVFCYADNESDKIRLNERINELRQQTSLGDAVDYLSEINFIAEDWIKSLAEHLSSAVVLLIDYGYPRAAYYHAQRNMGTLMCHFQHRAHPDPLILAGIQDITAFIDFTAMADAALGAGMEVRGFASQAHFLLNLGLLDMIDTNKMTSTQEELIEYLKISGEVKRLTMPGEMGETFKVMALAINYDGKIAGFDQYDIRHLL
ncbi:SAM-dependent methyltransferase, MidA [hydrothermal vent metagenome]|uniref:SAM-dependent methyltransferase, MidA n=1 Tax=hydrothermal vent metagenome TaxID=652676 RepID=A0A3B1AID6_9ZZZZ